MHWGFFLISLLYCNFSLRIDLNKALNLFSHKFSLLKDTNGRNSSNVCTQTTWVKIDLLNSLKSKFEKFIIWKTFLVDDHTNGNQKEFPAGVIFTSKLYVFQIVIFPFSENGLNYLQFKREFLENDYFYMEQSQFNSFFWCSRSTQRCKSFNPCHYSWEMVSRKWLIL